MKSPAKSLRGSTFRLMFLAILLCFVSGCSSKDNDADKEQNSSRQGKPKSPLSPKEIEPTTVPPQAAELKQEESVSSCTDNNTPSEMNSTKSAERKVAARPVNNQKVKDLVAKFKQSESSESRERKRLTNTERQTALRNLQGDFEPSTDGEQKDLSSSEILTVVSRAIGSEEEETRIEAVSLLSEVHEPQAETLLNQALNDPSEDVRAAALEVVGEQIDDIQIPLLQSGIKSPCADVKNETVEILEGRDDRTAVEILIEGLNDNDAKFRKKVNEALDFMIDRSFKDYEEAKTWWSQNKNKYDNELFLIEDQ